MEDNNILGITLVILLISRCFGFNEWSWWIILSPVWIAAIIVCFESMCEKND